MNDSLELKYAQLSPVLAKFLARAPEIGLRRAVGASRREVFTQYLTEAGMVGVVGALCGLVLTILGLAGLRGNGYAIGKRKNRARRGKRRCGSFSWAL